MFVPVIEDYAVGYQTLLGEKVIAEIIRSPTSRSED